MVEVGSGGYWALVFVFGVIETALMYWGII